MEGQLERKRGFKRLMLQIKIRGGNELPPGMAYPHQTERPRCSGSENSSREENMNSFTLGCERENHEAPSLKKNQGD